MNPSLALIPCAFDTGKLYSVLPDDGTGDFTVSRNGTATYLGSDGLLKTALANEPRLEFNTDGTFKGVLVEPASTNVLPGIGINSATFWYGSGVTLVQNATTAPDGNLNAVAAMANSSNPIHSANMTFQTFQKFEILTMSIFVKPNGETVFWLGGYFGNESAVFNLETGTLISKQSNVISTKIEVLKNGWFRLSVTYTFQNNIGNNYLYGGFKINPNTYKDGTTGVFVWGNQVERNSFSSSYIYPLAAQTTRPADVISIQDPSGITQIKTINNNIETTTTPTGGLFTLPNGNIKRVLML